MSDHIIVALIELVSPDNKASNHAFKTFVDKVCGVLDAGIHLMVIDPFPPGKRDPNGIHAAIWQMMVRKSFSLPAEKLLTMASYSFAEQLSAFVEPIAVGDSVPTLPLFLDPEAYVNVPLETTYQTAWETFPREWRDALTTTS